MVASQNHKWWALALLSVVQFMIVLDIAIVNVALPSIQVDLGFSQENLQWVISAYALFFGGFLLLGGRTADLVGRRRMFVLGLALFSVASLLAGLAWNEPSLIGARALQGLGAAVIAPAALSILMTTFVEGKERNIALGVWGAVGGFGAAAGVLLGGVFTDALSWEWIFFLNIPVGIAAIALTPLLLRESRDVTATSFDAPGAVLVTAGLSAAVFGITQANDYGWTSAKTIGIFVAAAALLVGFVVWELRAKEPLMSFSIFRIKTVAGANIAGFILGTALFSMFLMLTLYMQQVLGFSAMKTGIAYLAVAGTSIIWAMVAQMLVTRVGVKPVLVSGMTLLTVGLVYFTQVSVEGTYLGDLLPGFLIIAMGMAFAFVSISIAALAGRPGRGGRAGLRPDQHLAADRRRPGHRRPLGGRDRADERRDGCGRCRPAGPDDRLPGGVLGRRRDRRGGRRRLARPDPQGGARLRPGGRGSAGRRLDRLDTTRVGPGSVRGLRASGVVRRAPDGEDHTDGGDWAPAARALCGCHSDRARRHGRRRAGDRRAARPHGRDQGARRAVRDERRVPRPLPARVADRRQPLERAVRDRDLRRGRVRRRPAVHRHGIPPGRDARRPAPRRPGRPGTGARLARTGRRRHSTPPTPGGSSTGT